MTYANLIKKINNEKTGIAKGYDIGFLQKECCFFKEEVFEKLIAKDLELFTSIETKLLKKEKPQDGDFVEYENNKFARISVIHSDGSFQLSNKIGVYVWSSGYAQASGCVWDPDLDDIERERLVLDNLIPTKKTRKGSCWTFSGERPEAHRGVNHNIQFKVWKLG